MEHKAKLRLELLQMTRASLEMLIYEFTRVQDISLEDLRVTTAVDNHWVNIEAIRFYWGCDMFFCGYLDDERTLGVSYDISEIPNGGLIDTILRLESRLK